ncbi:MAG TPA: signal peptidase II [Candidatus Omnitrophica bacterium]|nr:signal peptidase II [Candidatus Omnitrophota bacterium]
MGFYLFIPFLIIVLDQVSKYFACRFLGQQDTVPLVKGVFHLTLTGNQGAAFSILQGGLVFFVIVSAVCIFGIIAMLCRPRLLKTVLGFDAADKLIKISLALILGGACGNLIDRLRLGYVVDFLDFRVWPVFNLADSAITVGALLICWKMIFRGHKARQE